MKEEPKDLDVFTCCEQSFDSVTSFKEHMAQAHGITELKGTRQMILHLDCAHTFSSNYECDIKGVKFTHYCVRVRSQYRTLQKLKAKGTK